MIIDSSRHVFIGGLHRSGTSLLHRCLGDHPEVSIFRDTGAPEDEGQHLQSVYPPASIYGGPGEFGFEPDAHLTEFSDLVTEDAAEQLFVDWSEEWKTDRPVLVEKSPPNLIRMRFLQALFPDARFIVLMRHPIAVSLATKKWSDRRLGQLLKHWVHCYRIFEQDRSHIARIRVIRYEDFVTEPDAVLADLFDFIGLDHCPPRRDIRPSVNERYWELHRRMRTHDPIRRMYVTWLRYRFEPHVRKYGYTLTPDSFVVDPRS